jgi:hypothetical protein
VLEDMAAWLPEEAGNPRDVPSRLPLATVAAVLDPFHPPAVPTPPRLPAL